MGSEWTKCPLSSIADIQTGPFGSQLHASDYVSDGIPSIMPQNIGDNRIDERGIARITIVDAKRLEKYRVKIGDIVYSRRGDVELRALVRNNENGWLCGTGCLRVRISTPEVDCEFASFYLSTPWSRAWIVQHAHGATMPNLNTSILGEVPFAYPDIKTQQSIAATFSSLDDKIELNNRIIANLEAQAQAIFKSWFVDFEPFQDGEFEENELGMIPKGWRVGRLGDAVEIQNRTFKPNSGSIKVEHYSIPAYDELKFPIFEEASYIKSNKFYVNTDCFMISKLNPETKRIWRPLCLTSQSVCSTEFIVYKAKKSKQKLFYYSLIDGLSSLIF